jgi:peptide/nickel transport system substrate-binding protein
MKKRVFWIVLSCVLVTSLVLASCSKSTSTSTTQTTQTTQTTSTTTTVTHTVTTTTPTTQVTTTTTTAATGNWWDKLGVPEYGGTLTIRGKVDITNFDPYNPQTLMTLDSAWMEKLFGDNWTLDPSVFAYQFMFRPNELLAGQLATSWEFTSPGILVVHLRHGNHWQNIAPANGREFTADDVAFHYDREFGLGDGFTKAAPFWGGLSTWPSMKSVIATDKYTVTFTWTLYNPEVILELLQSPVSSGQCMENSDAVTLWGNVNDWHHAIGTGPFILQDFVSGSSATMIKNPNYWGYDERYPQNQLPYIDTLRYLIIPDDATALAAVRSGKIDVIDAMSFVQSQAMKKSNPEIVQVKYPLGQAITVDPRNDVKPYNDIRVREALQMSLDLPTIANTYYGGDTDPWPSSLTSNYLTGWGFPYSQWPQDLKDQYAYNPTAAKQLLADAGYPNGFKTDIVADSSGDMDLLQIVKSYFMAIGVDMSIQTMDPASWVAYVQQGWKQDALAQRNTNGALGLTYEPTSQVNKYLSSSPGTFQRVNDPKFDANITATAAATTVDQVKQILIDDNKLVAQQHFVISLLQPKVYGFNQPWLKGYNGQYGAISGMMGPSLIYFYEARFWIDQDLKTSMGH